MMKLVRLIRHGESAANAGAPTQDHASIPLTEHGDQQAREVAFSFCQYSRLDRHFAILSRSGHRKLHSRRVPISAYGDLVGSRIYLP